MQLSDPQLKQLHACLLSALKIFDKFCRDNNLKYFLLGGSALGAIRHGGFIPWDDDIDIGMPRKDYDLLMKIYPKDGINNIVLKTNETNPMDHVYPWAKIEDSTTSLIVNWHKHLNPTTGVFIDLFPLDGSPESRLIRNYYFKLIKLFRHLLTGSYLSPKHQSIIKKFIIYFLKFNISRKVIYNLNSSLLRCFPYNNSEYVGNPMGEYGKNEVMLKNIYGKPKAIRFEDMETFVPEETEKYLTTLYGANWSELPPIEKRVSLHEFSHLSFNKLNKNL